MAKERYSNFGIVLHPAGGQDVDWTKLDKFQIVEKLREFGFPKPYSLARLLTDLTIKADPKPKKYWKEKDKREWYHSRIIDMGGQLEQGTKNSRPHYQMWISVTPKVTESSLRKALSLQLYNVERSNALSVQVLSSDMEAIKDYCRKEDRANLVEEFSHPEINKSHSDWVRFLDDEPELKEIEENDLWYTYQTWVFSLALSGIRTRTLFWLTDIDGNSGKSLMTDKLEFHPDFNVLRLSIDHHRAFKYFSALSIKRYVDEKRKEPDLIIIDAPRSEESKFLHEIYGTLEDINNGRVEGSYGVSSIKMRIRRKIPIVVISNSPPQIGSMSHDRWDIKAIFKSVSGEDRMIQDAKVFSNVLRSNNTLTTWQDVIQTKEFDTEKYSSDIDHDRILMDSTIKNYQDMLENYNSMPIQTEEQKRKKAAYKPGVLKQYSTLKTAPTHKAPEHIQTEVLKIDEQRRRNSLDY